MFFNRYARLPLIISLLICSVSIAQTLDEKINELLAKMTLEEKVKQLHQEGSFNSEDNLRLNIPGFRMADGPHGVRSGAATSFPVGMGLAAMWDTDVAYRVGVAMGKEFHAKGIHQALGPCLDLTLDPRNGRSPESSGEDPYLNGKINTAIVKGIQSTPVIATVKHFYTEYRQVGRTTNDYTLSHRNILDQHGLQFKEAIQEGGAFSVMNAYNLLNKEKCAENSTLLTTDLRTKWGFPFYVVSDWASINSAEKAIKAGCEIEMGSTLYQNSTTGILNLVKTGKVTQAVLDNAVRRVLRTKYLSGMMDNYPQGDPSDVNSPAHQLLSLEAGKKGLVLLKNQENILPLNKNSIGTIAVLGPNAAVMQIDGAGSSYVEPFYKVSPKEGIEKYVGTSKVLYAKGCDISGTSYASDLNNALTYAGQADVVIFFGGLDQTQEGEGFDRANGSIELPGKQKDLIKLLAGVNKKIIVVLISGGICTVSPFINDIQGLIYGFYPGQEGGNAIAQVLFGDYNPSGKLPVTMPVSDSQLSDRMLNNLDNNLGGGYRWFDKNKLTPQFPFGFGLSYTTFSFSNLYVSESKWFFWEKNIQLSVDVTNTGSRAGEEVVQLYLTINSTFVTHHVKELKGFKKVYLEPGETKTVTFELGPGDFYYFRQQANAYEIDPGPYTFLIGNSSTNFVFSSTMDLRPHPPLPDLQIANIYTIPRYPQEGDKVIFLATLLNKGTGPSPKGVFHEVKFKVDGNSICRSFALIDSISKGGMALICSNSNDSGAETNYWVAGKPGTYTIEATVDDKSAIIESMENNNSKTSQLKVHNKPAVNLALKKSVTVSSIESLNYIGDFAVDGSYGTRWSSQFSDPQIMLVDLGSVTRFNEIRIVWETAFGKEYTIEASNDQSTWKKIVDQKNGFGSIEKWSVNGEARYIRLNGIKRGTEYGYSIIEFEVYDQPVSDVEKINTELPLDFSLSNNYPNPFNPETVIEYTIPKAGRVELKVYDVLGNEVATLIDDIKAAGRYKINFSSQKYSLSSGVYFYRMSTEGITFVKKMVLIK